MAIPAFSLLLSLLGFSGLFAGSDYFGDDCFTYIRLSVLISFGPGLLAVSGWRFRGVGAY